MVCAGNTHVCAGDRTVRGFQLLAMALAAHACCNTCADGFGGLSCVGGLCALLCRFPAPSAWYCNLDLAVCRTQNCVPRFGVPQVANCRCGRYGGAGAMAIVCIHWVCL